MSYGPPPTWRPYDKDERWYVVRSPPHGDPTTREKDGMLYGLPHMETLRQGRKMVCRTVSPTWRPYNKGERRYVVRSPPHGDPTTREKDDMSYGLSHMETLQQGRKMVCRTVSPTRRPYDKGERWYVIRSPPHGDPTTREKDGMLYGLPHMETLRQGRKMVCRTVSPHMETLRQGRKMSHMVPPPTHGDPTTREKDDMSYGHPHTETLRQGRKMVCRTVYPTWRPYDKGERWYVVWSPPHRETLRQGRKMICHTVSPHMETLRQGRKMVCRTVSPTWRHYDKGERWYVVRSPPHGDPTTREKDGMSYGLPHMETLRQGRKMICRMVSPTWRPYDKGERWYVVWSPPHGDPLTREKDGMSYGLPHLETLRQGRKMECRTVSPTWRPYDKGERWYVAWSPLYGDLTTREKDGMLYGLPHMETLRQGRKMVCHTVSPTWRPYDKGERWYVVWSPPHGEATTKEKDGMAYGLPHTETLRQGRKMVCRTVSPTWSPYDKGERWYVVWSPPHGEPTTREKVGVWHMVSPTRRPYNKGERWYVVWSLPHGEPTTREKDGMSYGLPHMESLRQGRKMVCRTVSPTWRPYDKGERWYVVRSPLHGDPTTREKDGMSYGLPHTETLRQGRPAKRWRYDVDK